MKAKLAAAFLVTWRVTGTLIIQCPQDQRPDPMVGGCLQPIDVTRSAPFDSEKLALMQMEQIKKIKSDAYKISEVHLYSEKGAR